jgi:hypothetical protein
VHKDRAESKAPLTGWKRFEERHAVSVADGFEIVPE